MNITAFANEHTYLFVAIWFSVSAIAAVMLVSLFRYFVLKFAKRDNQAVRDPKQRSKK